MIGRPRSTYSRRARVVAADADADASLRDAIANEPAESPQQELPNHRWQVATIICAGAAR